MKKLVAMLLCGVMAISTVTCVNAESTGGDVVEKEEALEDVTLSVFVVTQGDLTTGIADDPIAELIKEKTGVTMDIVAYSGDKHNAMVASGDLYDLTVIAGAENITPLIETGAVADLSEWIDQAPNVAENTALLNYSKEYLSADTGNLYVLPLRTKQEEVALGSDQNGNFVRWEHYVEAGSPELDSIDALLDLYETIQNNHPTNANGQKTYAISQWSDWGAAYWTPLGKILGRQGVGCHAEYDLATLEYIDILNDDNSFYKNAQFLFEANQRGLLDPEGFSQKYEDFVAKVNDGRVLTSPVEYGCRDATTIFENAGETGFVEIPFVDTEEFPTWVNRSVPFGYTARLLVVSSKCDEQKMAVAMRLIDFIYSEDGVRSILSGPEGIVWEYDENGVANFTDEALAAMEADSNYLNSQGASWYTGIVGYDFDAVDSNGRYFNLTMNPDYIMQSMKDYEKEYCEYYGVDIPLEVFSTRENQTTENMAYSSFMPAEVPTDISRIETSVSDYMSQQMYALVLSEDQAAFDAKVEEIKAELVELGYETVSSWYKEAWENAVATYNELVK